MPVTTAEAWDLWREACCEERGAHWWKKRTLPGGYRAMACQCCPALVVVCDVCRSTFRPSDEEQRRCSDTCREFASRHRDARTRQLFNIWEQAQAHRGDAESCPSEVKSCPSGKIRHPTKQEAQKAAKAAEFLRYSGFRRRWLSVYQCSLCSGGWHLTSKPRRKPRTALQVAS